MLLAPYIAVFFMAAIFSLFIVPRFEYNYPSLKYITESYPYALVRYLIDTQSSSSPTPYQQTSRKTIIKASTRTKPDTDFGDQETAWKPVESSQSDDNDDFYYSDEYTADSMGIYPAPFFSFFLEYLQFLLYSIRILAISAWYESNVFHRPETTLEFEAEQSNESMPESLQRICEVLLLSGIKYSACQSLNQLIVVDQVTTSTPWTEANEFGIRWKEVRNGADKGCFYFIKSDNIPLKLSAIPNEDGTTQLSYFTKNTIGKYCPEGDNPLEVERFYKSLIDEIQPAKLTVFLNTKVFGEFTVYDLLEFQMLMDACLIALYKNLSQNGPPTRKTLIEFFILYGIVYGFYYVFVK